MIRFQIAAIAALLALSSQPTQAQSCDELEQVVALLDQTALDIVALSVRLASDTASAGLFGELPDQSLVFVTDHALDPILSSAEAANDRLRNARAIVRSSCPD